MGLFGQRRDASPAASAGSPAATATQQQPQGLASLVAMLHTKQGAGSGGACAAGTALHSAASASLAATGRLDSSSLGLFAAASTSGLGGGSSLGGTSAWLRSIASHAVSPGSTSYQPQSPQL